MGAGLYFGLALAPNMSGSTYSSVSLYVVCFSCVVYLSCLSNVAVNWFIVASSVRIAFMITTWHTLWWCLLWTSETRLGPSLQRRLRVSELHGAIHLPNVLKSFLAERFDALLLFKYDFLRHLRPVYFFRKPNNVAKFNGINLEKWPYQLRRCEHCGRMFKVTIPSLTLQQVEIRTQFRRN